ncbi:MAG: DNA recombination protein RmuC [Victivallales bacterium]|nr:DNA recombination protein RmuC [Victivallales bacterium]
MQEKLWIIVGVEAIGLVSLLVLWALQRAAISRHQDELEREKRNFEGQLQGQKEANEALLRQKERSAQDAMSRQSAAYDEAKRLLTEQYEQRLRQQQEQAERQKQEQASFYDKTIKEQEARLKQSQEASEKAAEGLVQQCERRLAQQKEDFAKATAASEERWRKELTALREEFQNSAGKMLEERTVKLDASNQRQMKELFEPFREKLKDLHEQLAISQKERASLKSSVEEQVKNVKQNADRMVSEADRLTNALRGTNKLQGNWGELQLEQALVDCGLVKGENFAMQQAITDESGKTFVTSGKGERLIPDATVFFPDGRRVFIDSKVSINAYLKYIEAKDDASRAEALKEHLASVRNHIRLLGEKKYHEYGNRARAHSSFDWTIMFMGNEGALALALGNDRGLWEDAFKNQKVVLVSRMSLYPLLWLIRMAWQFEKQSKNQENILDNTQKLIDRLDKFVGTFGKVGDKLAEAQRVFNDSRRELCESVQGVIPTARRVAEGMGKETKRLQVFEGSCLNPEP